MKLGLQISRFRPAREHWRTRPAAYTPPRLEGKDGPVFRGKRGPYTDRGIRNLLAVLGRRADVAHRLRRTWTWRSEVGERQLPPSSPYSTSGLALAAVEAAIDSYVGQTWTD